jgi:hypothetical protein
MRPKSGLFFSPGPDIFELFLRVFERFFQQLKPLLHRQLARYQIG